MTMTGNFSALTSLIMLVPLILFMFVPVAINVFVRHKQAGQRNVTSNEFAIQLSDINLGGDDDER